jgi:hypothetical protein
MNYRKRGEVGTESIVAWVKSAQAIDLVSDYFRVSSSSAGGGGGGGGAGSRIRGVHSTQFGVNLASDFVFDFACFVRHGRADFELNYLGIVWHWYSQDPGLSL